MSDDVQPIERGKAMNNRMQDPDDYRHMEQAMSVLGDKWAFWVIGELSAAPKRFHELRRALRSIHVEQLSGVLYGLEQLAIVHRRINTAMPDRLEYALTESGIDFLHRYFDLPGQEDNGQQAPSAILSAMPPPEDYSPIWHEQEDSP
jgi:DNA-binding HxlR family transcriptional regulator